MLELVFTTRSTGSSGAPLRLVNTWSDDAGAVFARAFADGPRRRIEWPGIGAFEFTGTSPTVLLHGSPSVDRARAHDIFSRIVQPIVLQAQGTETLHASAVVGPRGAVALAGVSGSGKSTLAWALGQRTGFRQIADDAVVMDSGDTGAARTVVHVWPIPYLPRLRRTARESLTRNVPPDPPRVDIPAGRPRLSAVVLLEQADTADPTARPVRLAPPDAFTAVLAHAYCFDEDDRSERERMVRHYLDLAATVPVFRLRYRPDFSALPDLVDGVIAVTSADDVRSA